MRLAFSLFVAAGFVLAALATLLGLAADRFPWLELFNHFRPFMLAGAVVLLALAAFTRRRDLIILCALLAFANAALFTLVLQGKAEAAPEGSRRFLRVIALNLWTRNQEIDKVMEFLANSEADVISLSELRSKWLTDKFGPLKTRYPYRSGAGGIVIFSKYPFEAEGILREPHVVPGRTLIARWVRLDVNGANFDFVGVHLSWPFKPDNQVADVNALITSVHDASVPLILAGDFNLTPWSLKLQRFAKETGLKRVNTWLSTWPANRLLPFVNIDNVFVSPVFSVMDVSTGPYLGSDHRPIIADIALTKDSTKEAAAH